MIRIDQIRGEAHRRNIERYRKLLRTKLTFDERRHIERRLAEEQGKLEILSRRASQARPEREHIGDRVREAGLPPLRPAVTP